MISVVFRYERSCDGANHLAFNLCTRLATILPAYGIILATFSELGVVQASVCSRFDLHGVHVGYQALGIWCIVFDFHLEAARPRLKRAAASTLIEVVMP